MAIVTQWGSDGATYDTKDYPYVLLNTLEDRVYGRFSTLEKAHRGRLMHMKYHPNDMGVMLYNESTKKFLDWRKKELIEFEKNKEKWEDEYA